MIHTGDRVQEAGLQAICFIDRPSYSSFGGFSVGGLSLPEMIARFVLDGPINRTAFETFVDKVLVPAHRPGDVLIMDNLSCHKGQTARGLV